MRTAAAVLISTLSVAAACRDTHHGDDGPDGSTGAMKIQDVQSDMMAPGTPVELKGVVVTAIDAFGDKKGDIWIEEPEGGPYSGIHVYNAPLDVVATLQLGDIVDLKGAVKDEFALASDTSGNTVTELKPASGGQIVLTKVSSGTPLAPQVVDALSIGQMSDWKARAAAWEPWEGVLIQVNNVNALGSPQQVSGSNPDMTLQNFSITGDAIVESSQAAFPMGITRNACLASVTGVLDYFFDYLVLPRTTAEVATGGSACPPPEASPSVCADGLDNDGNGFADCADNGCIVGASACRTVTTISAIQTATTPPKGGVELQDVYVVAMSKNKKNLWVQTSLTAAANQGIYVFGPGTNLDTFPVGSKVNIIGTVSEFNDSMGSETLTELKALSVTAGTAGTGTVVPVTGQTAAALSTESYESVLVTLTNVKVSTVGTSATFGVGDVTQYPAATVLKTDDDIALLNTANACYSSITGVWTYLVYENAWGFLPLTATGTAGGTCQ